MSSVSGFEQKGKIVLTEPDEKTAAFHADHRHPTEAASGIRIETIEELALALSREVGALKEFGHAEFTHSLSLYDEVRRFEVGLIRCALMRTGGHQRRAARLLGIKVTTLNAKIKRYGLYPAGMEVNAA